MWNKKNIAIGCLFAFFSAICGVSLAQGASESFYITGVIVFAIVAIAFFKRAKK